ncbi:MAG: FxDxF family PEP-CTERM protein [Gammaproteobacteria bacterium]|nr:FxDxF family PEP-CTERM protein [Gammaproteobacteria bacterium]
MRKVAVGLVGAALAATAAGPAAAYMTLSAEEVGPNTVTTNNGTITNFMVPGANGYVGGLSSSDETAITGAPNQYTFYDDYLFSIPVGAASDSITSTIDLNNVYNINGLDVRLYQYSTGTNGSGTSVNPVLVLGTPNGTVYESTNSGGTDMLNATLAAGTYVLEVRGVVTGSSGGEYAGTLQVAPVPLPAALPLLISGLGLLGGLVRRR